MDFNIRHFTVSSGNKKREKVPPEFADFTASDRRSFAVFSSWYWINDKGIWKDNKLLYTWSETNDLQILRTWVESRTKARTFTATDVVLNQGPDAVVYGVVRVFLNDRLLYQK